MARGTILSHGRKSFQLLNAVLASRESSVALRFPKARLAIFQVQSDGVPILLLVGRRRYQRRHHIQVWGHLDVPYSCHLRIKLVAGEPRHGIEV